LKRVRKPRAPDLRTRLEEAEATINAISLGHVDAVVVKGAHGPQVYTLEGADHPYRVLVEQMHEGTVTLDSDRVILYSNRQFATILGIGVESVTGARFEKFLEAGEHVRFHELLEAAIAHGHSSGEFNFAAIVNGHAFPVHLSLTRLEVSGMQVVCLVANDLREQMRNLAIVKEEQLSRLILDQAGEAIVVIEPKGIITRASQSARELGGGPILGAHFDHVFPLTAAGAAEICQAAHEGRPIRGMEAALVQPERERCSVLISASPLWSDDSELLGCVITLTDITRRKRTEEALGRQAEQLTQANSDLRQFAHSASHDLREPLRQLAVFNEMLQKRYGAHLDEEAAGLIQHSIEAAHRMEDLLRGLLEYTQAADQAQHPAGTSDTNQVVAKVIATFEARISETGAQMEYGTLPQLMVHEVHLTQLFQNLVGNALKYRGEAPTVIRISAEPDGRMWRIAVSDNGIGIPREYHDRVFALFQRLHGGGKYAGSGIGLAICQKIVQRYGGRIWVESDSGQGATFLFTLPGGTNEAARS
jgi:PAS domain S-box-containing protein